MSKKLHKFTVDRSKWLQGNYNKAFETDSLLCDGDGRMCCVGFLAKSYGIPKTKMFGRGTIDDLSHPFDKKVPLTSRSLDPLYCRNDSENGTNLAREQALTKMFRKLDILVKFVGKYPTK